MFSSKHNSNGCVAFCEVHRLDNDLTNIRIQYGYIPFNYTVTIYNTNTFNTKINSNPTLIIVQMSVNTD